MIETPDFSNSTIFQTRNFSNPKTFSNKKFCGYNPANRDPNPKILKFDGFYTQIPVFLKDSVIYLYAINYGP